MTPQMMPQLPGTLSRHPSRQTTLDKHRLRSHALSSTIPPLFRSYLTNSPYTSASVSNRPLGTNRGIVRLNQKQSYTLAFSQSLGNVLFLVNSINGNAL